MVRSCLTGYEARGDHTMRHARHRSIAKVLGDALNRMQHNEPKHCCVVTH